MTISLIHPSRGRPQKALETFRHWMNKASGQLHIQHILSIDSDDSCRNEYWRLFQHCKSVVVTAPNGCIVEAANRAAEVSVYDILVYLSDDFKCPQDWDKLIIQRTIGVPKFMLRVNDGHQPFENLVLTIPIMSRSLYNELGYFFYPEYKSMWCDTDLYMVTRPWIINAPDLLFPHERLAPDETYARNDANFEQGRAIFNRRRKQFGWENPFKTSKPINV